MTSQQKSVTLTIQKIFNWNDQRHSDVFDFNFYSAKTNTLILHKKIKSQYIDNHLLFNCSLKINYTQDQNQVVLRLARSSKTPPQTIAEFVVNLDLLSQKKVQFFPFGKNDKIIKIVAGTAQEKVTTKKSLNTFLKSQNPNEQFIKQRQDFLKKVNTNYTQHPVKRMKKSFSQKVHKLLSETRDVRLSNFQKRQSYQGRQQILNDYYSKGSKTYNNGFSTTKYPERRLQKSNSQNMLLGKIYKQSQKMNINNNFDNESDRISNKSGKQKLNLKNLDIVSCENEYYDMGEIQKPRISKMQPKMQQQRNNIYY